MKCKLLPIAWDNSEDTPPGKWGEYEAVGLGHYRITVFEDGDIVLNCYYGGLNAKWEESLRANAEVKTVAEAKAVCQQHRDTLLVSLGVIECE